MIKKSATRVKIAWFFFGLLVLETLLPSTAKALTSGPSQPETRQFAAAETSNMVDLFTGDFKYNIPLFDLDGYPVNLNYASGVGIDDEASWVGLGWNLNVGAINRGLRGLPDDASGDDVVSESYVKPKITVGGMVTGRVEVAGFQTDFAKIGFNGSLSLSIFSDNYYGYGADIGVGTGMSMGMSYSGALTSGLNVGSGISMNSSTQNGVSISPSMSLSVKKNIDDMSSASAGISANLGYNTREGLKSITMGASFNTTTQYVPDNWEVGDPYPSETGGYSTSYSKTSFNTPAFYPKAQSVFRTQTNSYSFDIGGAVFFGYLAGGMNGYKTVREIASLQERHKAYGFMYAQEGKQDPVALMDFMREKDNPVVPNLPNLAIPIATPDLFSYSGQAGSGQFRLYRGGSATFADPNTDDVTNVGAISAEYGFGTYFHGGFSYNKQEIHNRTGKWRKNNDFIAKGDYPSPLHTDEEHAYFKIVGEQTRPDDVPDQSITDGRFLDRIKGTDVVRVDLDGKKLSDKLVKGNGEPSQQEVAPQYRRPGRQIRRTPIMALTVAERGVRGPEHQIMKHRFHSASGFSANVCAWPAASLPQPLSFQDRAVRKPHHFSEITVQSENGMQMVYGLPVYNIKQQEITFSVDMSANGTQSPDDKSKNLVTYSLDGYGKIRHKHAKTDQYYRSETQPAYATSYLLTGVVSPEYQDLTGNGISDDDPGTAYKFNYSQVAGVYKWRSPMVDPNDAVAGKYKAQHNRGQLADPNDDKGNIIYGEKELWYLSSMESKTKIAFFITADRDDALGVTNLHAAGLNQQVRQKVLKEIRIYSKTDLITPIKTVVFQHDYSLCKQTYNSVASNRGKLTLKGLHFTYNGSERGKLHPYTFIYDNNPDYATMSADRWGNYKPGSANALDGFDDMANDEFPYAMRDNIADTYAGSWNLSGIQLPSGGEISIKYEADDYAYVQDRRAMQMTKIDAMVDHDGNLTTELHNTEGFRVKLPEIPGEARIADPLLRKEWFLRNYLNGQPYLYAKLSVNISDQPTTSNPEYFDYIPCYAEVERVEYETNNNAVIYFKQDKIGGIWNNPFTFAAWQKMRLEYPMYAYPGYKNRIDDDRPVAAAVSALTNAIGNFSELRMNFNKRAEKKGFGNKVNLAKSFTRLAVFQRDKYGGGSRVKRLVMNDKWNEMATGGLASTYGQTYDYTITEEGVTYSSGVATYEPSVGADENPMRMPVPYNQEFKWALSNVFYLEEPMGESLFPSPQVGYRKVTVQPIGADNNPSDKMGYTVSEFYTAKEFPVQVDQTAPEKVESETKRWFPFFGSDYAHEMYMSQGYLVKTNDMHGKPFRESVLARGGDVVSSMEYQYNARSAGSHQVLTGEIPTLTEHGKTDVIRQAVELYVDLREAETANDNKTYNAGVDVIPTFLTFPTPFPHIPKSKNNDYRLFRSASTLKTVEEYGVVLETVKTVNGSSIRSVTELFDGKTGQPLVTKTQNEFEDWIYSVNIPAFYVHNGMGMAYKTQGMFIRGLETEDSKGVIKPTFKDFLKPGDELLSLSDSTRLWVIHSTDTENNTRLRLIDVDGRVANSFTGDVKVLRSGYRNKLGDLSTTIVTTDPVNISSMFNTAAISNVLETKGTLYAEEWGRPTDCFRDVCPDGYTRSADGKRCIRAAQFASHNYDIVYTATNLGSDVGYLGAALVPHDSSITHDGSKVERLFGFWDNTDVSKFKWNAIWPFQNNQPIGTNQWWGVEFSVEIPPLGNGEAVYAGIGVDEIGRFFVDGLPFYEALNPANVGYNRGKWHIQPVTLNNTLLKPGKHTFRVEAMNTQGHMGAAMEIYVAKPADFQWATEASINQKRIFTTYSIRNMQNANVYKIDANGERYESRWSCPTGGTINFNESTPNCGVKNPGDCPEGYTKSADGEFCIPLPPVANNEHGLTLYRPADGYSGYDDEGARVVDRYGNVEIMENSYFGGGSFIDSGVFTTTAMRLYANLSGSPKWIGVKGCINLKGAGEKFIGYSSTSDIRVYINDTLVSSYNNPKKERQFNVISLHGMNLTRGKPLITIEVLAANNIQPRFGVVVLDGDMERFRTANGSEPPILNFNTAVLDNTNSTTYIRSAENGIIKSQYSCGGQVIARCDTCKPIRKNDVLNPYLTGYLGNWAPWLEFVYMDKRHHNNVFDHSRNDINIRKSGTYTVASPFLQLNNGTWAYGTQVTQILGSLFQANANPIPEIQTFPSWAVARSATMFNDRMEELESVDALNRYSSARFGFRNTLPVAVAANARHTEIYYDGFEDYHYWKNCLAKPACEISQFNIRNVLGEQATARLNPNESHTGNYSLRLDESIELQTWMLIKKAKHRPGIYLENSKAGEFYRKMSDWLGLWGFAPQEKKKYVFSAWAKVAGSNAPGTHITATLNGVSVSLARKATVDGWSLVEGEFTTPDRLPEDPQDKLQPITLVISGGANVLLDDIRIFPYEGQIKTYSYDERTLRLMGELDENNYATLYEYDDEGSLTRVKKETDRGIVTIKETRSANKKNPNVIP